MTCCPSIQHKFNSQVFLHASQVPALPPGFYQYKFNTTCPQLSRSQSAILFDKSWTIYFGLFANQASTFHPTREDTKGRVLCDERRSVVADADVLTSTSTSTTRPRTARRGSFLTLLSCRQIFILARQSFIMMYNTKIYQANCCKNPSHSLSGIGHCFPKRQDW